MAFRLNRVLLFKATSVVQGSSLQRWAYNLSGFHKYGLMRDDCLYETEDVVEALRRIPAATYDERNYRLLRALQLSGAKMVLPKDQWANLEDDVLYLSPVVEQVRKEREEREKWEQEY